MSTLSPETISDLMARFTSIMDKALDTKLKEITKDLATKSDVNELTRKVDKLQMENNTLRGEVSTLKTEILARDRRIEFIDNQIRRNNLIFGGLSHDGRNELQTVVEVFIRETLGIVRQMAIKDVVSLGGRKPGSRLLVRFGESRDVTDVLQASNRLKGTNFGINRDYSESVRAVRWNLFAIKRELQRLRCSLKVTVRSQYLVVDDMYFTWSDVNGIVYKDGNGLQVINSLVGLDIGGFVQELLKRNSSAPRPGPASSSGAPGGSEPSS
ncbi:hypothetical protein GE061_010420 [Apolygus lucorum]|uniref:Uncharacterized protein n=1 Tax=Apolygus lucorum TaxID=248454 RepID=A0A6A4IMW0_APOLU|nr:hypothetical protein GE061_005556 [Apolygus lucorum]KAF6215664.1 hypothetical protein GE061_010420 [Apolygus lucorum]